MHTHITEIKKVAILLSTFNGSRYLTEQLDSLFEQKSVNIHLIVRDDGSQDDTINILHEYKSRFPTSITLIQGVNIGWKESFFWLVHFASEHFKDFEYFAFCDQDDIWLPFKLKIAIDKLSLMLLNKPRLYCSDQLFYKNDQNYGIVPSPKVKPTYKSCLVKNMAVGCTVVFDRQLLELMNISKPNIAVPHDYWAYIIAVMCGNVYIDDNAYILYRQHENNQIGFNKNFFKRWSLRIKNLPYMFIEHTYEYGAKEIQRVLGTYLSQEAKNAVEKFAKYRHPFVNRIRLIMDKGYTRGNIYKDFWLHIKILLGII